jgi:hypothetical protein
VVERRAYTVTGQKPSEDEVDRLIETGESESIFAKAILEQGRGHVCKPVPSLTCSAKMEQPIQLAMHVLASNQLHLNDE